MSKLILTWTKIIGAKHIESMTKLDLTQTKHQDGNFIPYEDGGWVANSGST